jgi:hypothetical protein
MFFRRDSSNREHCAAPLGNFLGLLGRRSRFAHTHYGLAVQRRGGENPRRHLLTRSRVEGERRHPGYNVATTDLASLAERDALKLSGYGCGHDIAIPDTRPSILVNRDAKWT